MKTINKIRVNNFEGMIEMTEKGETLTKKIQRILDENETLTDGAPMIYTPKQAGVREDCNVRTDKWALAMDAMDRVNNYKLNEYLKKGEAEAPKTAVSLIFLATMAPIYPRIIKIVSSNKSIFLIGIVINLFPLISILKIY